MRDGSPWVGDTGKQPEEDRSPLAVRAGTAVPLPVPPGRSSGTPVSLDIPPDARASLSWSRPPGTTEPIRREPQAARNGLPRRSPTVAKRDGKNG
jgi:hypothetical protein